MDSTSPKIQPNKFKVWLKKIGWIGFFFFLIKGLIWLGVVAWFGNEFTK
jgi:hypothetical protein